MKTGMLAALLALFATIAGCATPASQQQTPPYGHFYSATERSSVTLNHGQHVAVLLGRNAAATLDYLQRHRDQAVPGTAKGTPVATLGVARPTHGWRNRSPRPSPKSRSTTTWTPCSPTVRM